MGSWPERPDDEFRWVTFREDWTGLSYPKDHTRYVLANLGDESVADSMSPDILPGSLVLLDYSDGARVEEAGPGMPVEVLSAATARNRALSANT